MTTKRRISRRVAALRQGRYGPRFGTQLSAQSTVPNKRRLVSSFTSRTYETPTMLNGEGGIRTRGTGLTPYDGLANRCFQPLSHLSRVVLTKT